MINIRTSIENIHIPNGYSSQLEDEAERYNQLLNDRGPVDIQILGIGENGHIGLMNLVLIYIVKRTLLI